MLYIQRYFTPKEFDDILMCIDDEVLIGLWFEGSHCGKMFFSNHVETDTLSFPPLFHEVSRWLDIYFSGHQPDFTPSYRINNPTSFRKKVLEIVMEIPFGKTMTYGDIAKRIGINSAQAVGGAVGWNPISIIVPCHRVMGTYDKLTGYGGGLNNKMALLKLEKKY